MDYTDTQFAQTDHGGVIMSSGLRMVTGPGSRRQAYEAAYFDVVRADGVGCPAEKALRPVNDYPVGAVSLYGCPHADEHFARSCTFGSQAAL